MEPEELLSSAFETHYKGPVFRAIYTSFPSKNLFADLGFREGNPDLEILQSIADRDVGIDISRPQQERPFQYGNFEELLKENVSEAIDREELLYPLRNAQKGRFSDGSHAVFYAALEEETALAEVVFHFLQDSLYEMNTFLDFTEKEVDKRVVKLEIDVACARDFCPLAQKVPGLTADSYDFCQRLGSLLWARGIPMALTPSARASGGRVAPIFKESALPFEPAKTLRYYRLRYQKTRGLSIERSDLNKSIFLPPSSWTFKS